MLNRTLNALARLSLIVYPLPDAERVKEDYGYIIDGYPQNSLFSPEALLTAFRWRYTPQGYRFWSDEAKRKRLSFRARRIVLTLIKELSQ